MRSACLQHSLIYPSSQLLGNALKYTDDGWVKVSLRSKDLKKTTKTHQSIVTLTVADSGRGISSEFLQGHLFTPFVQEDTSNAGTGLGMSIVSQILTSLGGTIDVTSEKGIGTEMVVSVTLDQVPLSSQRPSGLKYEHPAFSARKRTEGLTIGLIGFEKVNGPDIFSGELASNALVLLKLSVEKMVTSWFGMRVTEPSTWEQSPPDIYIANE
jgi:hypothetical protein